MSSYFFFLISGEDERYRATELNYHGPTVKGWRSAQNCPYPQEITMQLNTMAVLHRIQILAHQYLIREYCLRYYLRLHQS